jgi:hypothetical protein
MICSLHDMSGRDVHVARYQLRSVVHDARIGDRIAFTLLIDNKSGTLTAAQIEWLAPGQTISFDEARRP